MQSKVRYKYNGVGGNRTHHRFLARKPRPLSILPHVKPMNIIPRNCNFCNTPYQAKLTYLNRGQGLYCSRSCGMKYVASLRKPVPNVTCAFCDKPFYVNDSKKKQSKSGLYFCCRNHKDASQRLGGIQAIMPSHYGSSLVPAYRKKALAHYTNECNVCGWNEYPELLLVHHIDENRSNNSIDNLEILCPTHHDVRHYLAKSGKWRPQRA